MPDNKVEEKKTHTIKTDPEESKIVVDHSVHIGSVICNYLDGVMFDPTNMRNLELAIDKWIGEQKDRSPETKKLVLGELRRANQALESLYNRVASGY